MHRLPGDNYQTSLAFEHIPNIPQMRGSWCITATNNQSHNHWSQDIQRGGGPSSRDNFGGENFDTPPILMQGHQTWEALAPPTLGSLCAIHCVKLWQAQILDNTNSSEIKKKKQGPGWLSMPKEALARGKGVMRVQFPRHTSLCNNTCTKSSKCPKWRKKFLWGKFQHQTEKRSFPHELVP